MCVNTVPKRKYISNELRGATVAHQSGKGYEAISKESEVYHSTMKKKKFTNQKHSRQLPNFPDTNGYHKKFTPRSNFAMFRETAKSPRAKNCTKCCRSSQVQWSS